MFANDNMKIIKTLWLLIPMLSFAVSCSTPLKEVTYLNGIETNKSFEDGPLPETYRVRPNDQLYIQVISDDPMNAAFLNLMNTQGSSSAFSSSSGLEIITYLVDEDGFIEYPYLGQIKVKGLTIYEVSEKLQKQVDRYLEAASVFVKLVNRTITVLGEVDMPGQVPMVKNRLTIFEALGAAGDITDYGNRQNVKIIRQMEEGKYIAELNLTNPNIITSPYYYVLPHDLIYVEHSTKVYGAKNMPYAAPLSIFGTVISIGLLITNLFQ